MFRNPCLAVWLVLLLSKYGLCVAPGDGWFYSGDGGYEDKCKTSQCQTDCSTGYYRSGCQSNSSGSCVLCNNGPAYSTYTTRGNLISDCTWGCNTGYSRSGLTCIQNSGCTKTLPAYSTYSGTNYPNCDHQCNAGYFNAQSSVNPISCTVCQAGSFALQGALGCTVCPAGTFSNVAGSPSDVNCQKCPAGTYSTSAGASLSATCQNCQAGRYSSTPGASSTTACQDCPSGTASALSGAINAAACLLCGTGKYTNSTGRAVCASCDAGTVASGYGTIQCTKCLPNTYAPTPGLTACRPCDYCTTAGIFKAACGPISAGYCTTCTNPT